MTNLHEFYADGIRINSELMSGGEVVLSRGTQMVAMAIHGYVLLNGSFLSTDTGVYHWKCKKQYSVDDRNWFAVDYDDGSWSKAVLALSGHTVYITAANASDRERVLCRGYTGKISSVC